MEPDLNLHADYIKPNWKGKFGEDLPVEEFRNSMKTGANDDLLYPEKAKEYCARIRRAANNCLSQTVLYKFIKMQEVHLEDLEDFDEERIKHDPEYYLKPKIKDAIPESASCVICNGEYVREYVEPERYFSFRIVADFNNVEDGMLEYLLDTFGVRDIVYQLIPLYQHNENKPDIKRFYNLTGGPVMLTNRSTTETLDMQFWIEGAPVVELY